MIDDVDVKLLESRDRSRVADLISEVFSPPIVVVALLTAVSLHSSPDLPSALGWIALSTTFCAAIPYLLLLRSVRAGRVADRHLVRRNERRRPLLVALASVFAGVALLFRFSAPSTISHLVVAFLVGLMVMLPVTVRWKASMHVAIVAGTLAVSAAQFGSIWGASLSPALALVAWARIRSGRHTLRQATVGAMIGLFVGWVAFTA